MAMINSAYVHIYILVFWHFHSLVLYSGVPFYCKFDIKSCLSNIWVIISVSIEQECQPCSIYLPTSVYIIITLFLEK